jgi:hypothetical protein
LLDALAPGHPELLETTGSWSTLADLTLENVRAHAHLFLTGPLRLAVLTNTDDTQASHLRTALQRWIQPINRGGARCSRQQAPEAVAGVRRLKVAVSAGAEPVAYVGVRVPQEHADAARWTTWLLNRPNGWLERALERPGLASAARAHYLAGPEIGAVVVEVRALDNQTDRAVSQVVGLFERLSTGGVTEKDCRLARPAFASARLEATLHPLTRLAELYANRPWGSTPNLRALHDFLPLLRRNQLSVVVVSPDP